MNIDIPFFSFEKVEEHWYILLDKESILLHYHSCSETGAKKTTIVFPAGHKSRLKGSRKPLLCMVFYKHTRKSTECV